MGFQKPILYFTNEIIGHSITTFFLFYNMRRGYASNENKIFQ